MDIVEMLRDDEEAILAEALPAVAWLRHYGRDGAETARERLEALYRLVERAVRDRDLEELLAHARAVARERFEAGYDRVEVVAAFSALEEAICHQALRRLPAEEQAWALGLVGTALAHAKDALARAFASLGQGSRPAYTDMTRIFRGAEAGRRDRFAEDLVYPV
jgi:hypothetical protein